MEVYRDPYEHRTFKRTEPLPLTDDQQSAIAPILDSIENKLHEVFLLYGVTGSGKTEIYLQSIQDVIEKGREAIVLVPEIALTPQMVNRFKGRFGDLVAVMHSGFLRVKNMMNGGKSNERKLKLLLGRGQPFLPHLKTLELSSLMKNMKQAISKKKCRAIMPEMWQLKERKKYNCPVVLGSATPSLESFARAQKGVYQLLSLPNRMNNQALPAVEIIDMREELTSRKSLHVFSKACLKCLKDESKKKNKLFYF